MSWHFFLRDDKRKAASGIMLTLLLIGMLKLAFNIQPVKAEYWEFICGVTAYDWLGMKSLGGYWTELDPLQVLKENGVNWNRVGVCIKNYPVGHPESWCSIEYAEEVMKSSRQNGMRLDLFFYLSHTAAYAGQQPCPPEWKNFTIEEKAEALSRWCFNTTKYYREKGFNIEIYEIGNEIDFGILDELPPMNVDWWDVEYLKENIWNKEAQMLKGAIEGVKLADPNATILLHLACSSRPRFVSAFFKFMIESDVPFDIAGLSFYPSYTRTERPTISTLEKCIEEIARLGKKTLICEYAYPSSPSPEDPTYDGPVEGYPLTPEGQAKYIADFLRWCYGNPNVLGALYFYPDNCLSETEPEVLPGPHISLFFNDTATKPALNKLKTWTLGMNMAPVTTISLAGVLGGNDWFTSDVTATLFVTYYTEVDKTEYSLDNTTWIFYMMPFAITKEGKTIVYYRSTDKAGNVETIKTEIVKIDKTAPSGSITINYDTAYTNSTIVTLSPVATDAASGVSQMRFSNDNLTWTSWEPCSVSKAWTLTKGEGEKTVYYQVKDNAGLISQSYSDTITLDTTAPKISITSILNGPETRSSTVTVTWIGSDDLSGISHYEVRLDEDSWTNVGTNTTHTFTGLSDGSHVIHVKATDKAGNTEEDTVNFTVNTSLIGGPGWTDDIIALSASIITILIAAVYLFKIRKH